jgi:hypothetical protein
MHLDANDESYVPLIRKIKASEIVRSGPLSQLMIFLLADAAYYDRVETVPMGRTTATVSLTLGESFVNTKQLGDYLNIEERTLRRALHRLKDRGTVTLEVVHGGFKVRLTHAERYWERRKQDGTEVVSSVSGTMSAPRTMAGPTNTRASGNGAEVTEPGPAVSETVGVVRSPNEAQEMKGLTGSLRTIELLQTLHTDSIISPNPDPKSSGVGRGVAGQLDLIPPVAAEIHAEDLEVSGFFAAKEEPQWNSLQGKGEWIRSVLSAHPDVRWVLQELARYYQWWIENPKKRRKNLAASIGNWLRGEARKLAAGPRPYGTRSIQAPSEPGKYDGIGVVCSEFDLS